MTTVPHKTTGKRYDGDDDDDDCLASAPNGSYDGKRRQYDDTTVGTDSDRGQQLQDDTHDDEDYHVCVRIRAPRDHEGLMGANQVQTR